MLVNFMRVSALFFSTAFVLWFAMLLVRVVAGALLGWPSVFEIDDQVRREGEGGGTLSPLQSHLAH